MKKFLFIVFTGILATVAQAQGIEFEHGSWKDVLTKAQLTGKPIFVDVFTTWCGPCRMMTNTIFPIEEVGRYYNDHFVNYKMDAEKGEGIEFADHYEIDGYPTFLFIDPNGNMFYRTVGSRNKEDFILSGEKAFKEYSSSDSYSQLKQHYQQNQNSLQATLAFLKKRIELNFINDELLNHYLSLLTIEQQDADSTLRLICRDNNSIAPRGLSLEIFLRNRERILGFGERYQTAWDYSISMVMNKYIQLAVKEKDENLVKKALRMKDYFHGSGYMAESEELWCQYYKETGQDDKYVKTMISHLETMVMKISAEEIRQKDEDSFKTWKPPVTKEDSNSMSAAEWKVSMKYTKMRQGYEYASQLNSSAWSFFETRSDKGSLEKALGWSRKSLDFTNESVGAFLDTYANLLHKLGDTKSAIPWEKKAIEKGLEDGEDISSYQETLDKMIKGEDTWETR